LLSLDTDGVLTDGGIFFTDSGDELRKFNVKDGMGMKIAQAAGVQIAIITASSTPSIGHRATRLGVDHVFLAVEDKAQILTKLCDELEISPDQVVHVGDDVNDIPVLELVGIPMSVADAMPTARNAACYVTNRKGGDGAVREICDLIAAAKTGA
ncbi:MAG: HAD hydrolase family protein, partial [Rhodospirillales bacterium]|nr:HAD hydrolase family protein [Rhodospirillales bacterium]